MEGMLERLPLGESGNREPGFLLHLLVDDLPDSYLYQYVLGSDGQPRFTYISAGVERVHGVKPAEVLQDATCYFAQLPPPAMPETAAEEGTAPNLTAFETDLPVRRADGAERLIHVQSWPSRTPEGRLLWNGFALDVTARKTAEEDRLEAFVAATFEGAVESEADRIVACNEQFAKMLGYTVQELEGKPIGDLVTPEDRTRVLANIAHDYENVVNSAMLRKDGTRIIVEAHGCPIGSSRRRFTAVRDITAYRLAKDALARREQHLQMILATVRDGFWMADDQGRLLEVNATTCAMTGYSREELLAMNLEDLAAGPARGQIPARLRHVKEHGRALSFEGRLRRKDGRLVDLELSVNFLNQEGGRFFAFIRDVTAHKLAEAKVRETETQLRLVFESADIGIALVDMQGRPVRSNPALQKILGYTAQELNQMPFTQFTHPDDRDRDYAHYQELMAGKRDRYEIEKRYIRKDGEIVTGLLTVSLVKDTQGRPQYALGMVQDITERKRAEALLKESETRFRTLIEQAPVAIAVGRNGVILYVNQKFVEMFRCNSAKEQIGRPVWEYWAPEWQAIIAGHVRQRSLGLPAPPTYEGIAQRQDGSRFDMHVAITGVNLSDGPAVVALETDITERKQAEEAVRGARDQLAQVNADLERKVAERTTQLAEANANLENFAHTAAHDLRAPLRGITNFAELLVTEYGERMDEMGRSMLERMQESTQQMGQLLNDLLEYSHVTQKELQLEKVKLDETVREVLSLLESDIRSKQAEVRVEGPLPEVIAHPATVEMLISNIVSNGLKFVAQEVKPQLRIWAQPMPASANEETGESGFVRLWIEDNGIGIAPENQAKVFETFQRLHSKQAYPGTGLGLAIVRKGAERMGGRTGLESELGKGSRFWIELPGSSSTKL